MVFDNSMIVQQGVIWCLEGLLLVFDRFTDCSVDCLLVLGSLFGGV